MGLSSVVARTDSRSIPHQRWVRGASDFVVMSGAAIVPAAVRAVFSRRARTRTRS